MPNKNKAGIEPGVGILGKRLVANEMLLTEAIYYAELGSPTKGKMAVEKTVIQARADERAKVVSVLSECFKLAPVDDAYLRILVKDVLETLKTGKTRKQRADENMMPSNQDRGLSET